MRVVSVFDGISCGRVALERAGIKVDEYFACEIKADAIKVTQANYPDTIQLGDVRNVDFKKLGKIDLFIGGSPCQDMSKANRDRKGLQGNKSSLFWEYMRGLNETKAPFFLLENVEMPAADYATISNQLGVCAININSELVSAQLRNRYYWTNIGPKQTDMFGMKYSAIPLPKDRKIYLQSILTHGYADRKKARCLLESDSRPLRTVSRMLYRYFDQGFTTLVFDEKDVKESCRYLNQIELERCQTLPDGYTSVLDRDSAAGCISDGWTVDVIAHILSYMKEKMNINVA